MSCINFGSPKRMGFGYFELNASDSKVADQNHLTTESNSRVRPTTSEYLPPIKAETDTNLKTPVR